MKAEQKIILRNWLMGQNDDGAPLEVVDWARRRLCAQASSAISEPAFSKAGLVIGKKRQRLTADNVDGRDGHGIPKSSPCPSVLFFILPGPSVRFRIFLGWRVRMSVIRTAKIPKINKIKAKIRASVYYKTSESVFSKNIKKLKSLRCDI